MKWLRFVFAVVTLTLCVDAYAQSPGKPLPISDAQKGFAMIKTLVGNWQGPVTADSPAWTMDKPMSISIRVASQGNALVHELNTGTPEVTVFYMDGDRLTLIHYCDYGNRPQMVAARWSGGKTVEFDLVGLSGNTEKGHLSHGVFTIVDADHHFEDWTFVRPGDKPVHARFDLKRVR